MAAIKVLFPRELKTNGIAFHKGREVLVLSPKNRRNKCWSFYAHFRAGRSQKTGIEWFNYATTQYKSICSQTVEEYKVFLACNEDPHLNVRSRHLEILTYPFDLPENSSNSRMADKSAKLNYAAYAARSLATAFFMPVDADDYISNRLARFVSDNPDSHGWYLKRGYIHRQTSSWACVEDTFHLWCGSSSIIRCSKDDLPSAPLRDQSSNSLIHVGHTQMRSHMQKLGRDLEPLPFPGAIYEIGTGENDSGAGQRRWPGLRTLARTASTYRWMGDKIRSEFAY